MIVHVAMYQLTDQKYIEAVKQQLEQLSTCELIKKNQVHISCLKDTPVADNLFFADIIHIAYFDNMESASKYPCSVEHQQLMQNTGMYIKHVMTTDYLDDAINLH